MKQKLLLLLALFFSISPYISAQMIKQDVAMNWLTRNKYRLGVQPSHNFKMLFNRPGLSGETFRYYQKLQLL